MFRFISFDVQLLILFNFCQSPWCKSLLHTADEGVSTIVQMCCGYAFDLFRSHPFMMATRRG